MVVGGPPLLATVVGVVDGGTGAGLVRTPA
jgi:hypothetical protein